MTILTEISTSTVTTYEPTVADKIQRVLYRLEHGEKLIWGQMHYDGGFCVLGLFADESGLGSWEPISHGYNVGGQVSFTRLSDNLLDYYGFNSSGVSLVLSDLPNDLHNKVRCLFFTNGYYREHGTFDLSFINDCGRIRAYPHINQLLADIIRSGVLFQNKGD